MDGPTEDVLEAYEAFTGGADKPKAAAPAPAAGKVA